MDLVLGIDLGTSYFKVALFDRSGGIRGLGRIAVNTDSSDGRRCELPIDRFWSILRDGLNQALNQAGASDTDIRAAGYSSQANSFVLLDEHDRPLTPLVLWPDRRAEEIEPAVLRLWQRRDFLAVTGLGVPPGPGFVAAKLRWFQRHCPHIWSRVRSIMTISDHLVFGLTGRRVSDGGTCSLLGLWDLREHTWWSEALDALAISRCLMSSPLMPGAIAGRTCGRRAADIGLNVTIPLVVGGLDHHMAAVGAGVGQLAQLSESTGTVLACLRRLSQFEPRQDCCMGPGTCGEGYYQLAFDGNGAGGLEWYQQTRAPGISIPKLVEMAEDVPAGSAGLFAMPSCGLYSGLEGFRGVGPGHDHGHFVRAIMESTAATLAALVRRLCGADRPGRVVATGGGARSDLWLQIKADLLGTELVSTRCEEPACMGAAMLAAAAAEWSADPREASATWAAAGRSFTPRKTEQGFYASWHERYLQRTRA